MHKLALSGCTCTPFGAYLKALGVLRLVSEQANPDARGYWDGEVFVLESTLSAEDLAKVFLERYQPTPISALERWQRLLPQGQQGRYRRDCRFMGERFATYRADIEVCRALPEVQQGKAEKDGEDERRTAIFAAAAIN